MSSQYSDPGDRLVSVTASDSTDLTGARAVYVGGTGDVALRAIGSGESAVTFTAVPVGTIIPVRIDRVMATNTTATAIVAIY